MEARWHLAQVAPRLPLNDSERASVARTLFAWLDDKSRIVQASALTALCALALTDPDLRAKVKERAETFVRSGAPSLRARARLELKGLSRRRSP